MKYQGVTWKRLWLVVREYLKIVVSILVSLAGWSLIATILTAINVVGNDDLSTFLIPWMIALIGFVMFGVIGSILWWIGLLLVFGRRGYTFIAHVFSAILATALVMGGGAVSGKGNGFRVVNFPCCVG